LPADLKPKTLGEKLLGRLLVRRAEHAAAIAQDADGTAALLEAHLDRTRAIIADFGVGAPADTRRPEVRRCRTP
jgi:hypothetical protein